MDSILLSIKNALGIESDYDGFDAEIIFGINTAFMLLNQLGVGPSVPYKITDDTAVWTDFLGTSNLEAAKTYVQLKVRLLFDPPANSFLVDAINKNISELEWRLTTQVEFPPVP